jgi:hypothetical protein
VGKGNMVRIYQQITAGVPHPTTAQDFEEGDLLVEI